MQFDTGKGEELNHRVLSECLLYVLLGVYMNGVVQVGIWETVKS